jgi:hypothetical protein
MATKQKQTKLNQKEKRTNARVSPVKRKVENAHLSRSRKTKVSASQLYYVNRPPVWWKPGMEPCASFEQAIQETSGDESVTLCEQFFNSNGLHVLRSSFGDPLANVNRETTDWYDLVQFAEKRRATSESFSLRRDCAYLEPQVLERLKELAMQGYMPSFITQTTYTYEVRRYIPIRYDLALIEIFGTQTLKDHRDAQGLFYAHIRRLLHSTPEKFLQENTSNDEVFRVRGDHDQQYSFPYEVKRFVDSEIEFHQTVDLIQTAVHEQNNPPMVFDSVWIGQDVEYHKRLQEWLMRRWCRYDEGSKKFVWLSIPMDFGFVLTKIDQSLRHRPRWPLLADEWLFVDKKKPNEAPTPRTPKQISDTYHKHSSKTPPAYSAQLNALPVL